MHSAIFTTLLSALPVAVLAQKECIDNDIPFFGCAPLGAYYPPPTISKTSKPFKSLISQFTKTFEDLIKNGGSEKYGEIAPNTTSFSVIIFGGDESLRDDPVFFEYHYTSPEDQASNDNVTLTTKFPLGDVSMVFTVYAWLAKMGEQWEAPITKYLPELANVEGSLKVAWDEITIGALAGQVSGLSRESFKTAFANKSPYFLPDTTPIASYAAFQLLAFAMQRTGGAEWSSVLEDTLLSPLNMTSSGVLSPGSKDIFAMESLNSSLIGEPAALSLVSSMKDLARAGHSILASDLLSPAITRRWLHHMTDTSNLRNGVGRPWEIYRAGKNIRPIIDALTKGGAIGKYASYFGLTTDFNAGFAILAHDSTVEDRKLDLNVIADIVSEVLGYFQQIAHQETDVRYAGKFESKNAEATFNTTDNGHGLVVQKLMINGVNVKDQTAKKLGIQAKNLDFRIYPSNVQTGSQHQWIAVFQDRSALIDMGTPTCITWQQVGADVEIHIVFTKDKKGNVVGVEIPQLDVKMKRAD
ncbi:beta-lactamase/transpeptidase-like protein [Fusarium acuminatum]|uniref:Beta-lactamase/transpeptidase-like protein n=1 Tax=Fusarium acuminatum TaxID=5515 RepID=A0ABZ2X0Q5_9HYPO